MEISRRLFLSLSIALVVDGCSSDAKSEPSADSDPPLTPQPSTTAVTQVTAATQEAPAAENVPAPTVPATTGPASTGPASSATETNAVEFATDPFTLGIASGDPNQTSVILWTRLALDPLHGGGMGDEDVSVWWEMSTDAEFETIVADGSALASVTDAHTVHIDAAPSDRTAAEYFYRFRAGGFMSPVGRTKLAPTSNVASTRFVSASCQNYEDGFFAAHADIAAQSPDFLLWLGDYIYEGAGSPAGSADAVRSHASPEPKDLTAYRNRYALYKSDSSLQAAHQACPWFVIWDDHEVENNYAGLIPQDPTETATFGLRRQQAYKAWWEHQPVRLPPPGDEGEYRIYRSVRWGDLVGLALLDTRQYRSDQGCGDATLNLDPACSDLLDATRTLTGAEQQAWLFSTLGQQDTLWNVIAQQIVMADITLNGAVLNYDQWDGYPQARQRILQHLADANVPNTIVLSGDIHLAGVAVLRAGERDTSPAVAIEFVDTSISSGGLVDAAVTDLVKSFPDIVDVELEHRGYILHTVTANEWSAQYRFVENVALPDSPVTVYRTFVVNEGTSSVAAQA